MRSDATPRAALTLALALALALTLARADTDETCAGIDSPWQSLAAIPLDAHGRLADHWLLVPERCGAEAANLQAGLSKRRVAVVADGGALAAEIGLVGAGCPAAACLERGTPPELLAASADRYSAAHGYPKLGAWVDAWCQNVHFGVLHFHEAALTLRWVDGKHPSSRREYNLPPGGSNNGVTLYRKEHWQIAKLGERYEVVDGAGVVVKTGLVEYSGPCIVGSAAPFDPGVFPKRDWPSLIAKTRYMELHRASKVSTAYTPNGSKIVPVPPATWASMTSYYHNNRQNRIREEWQPTASTART
jgi:hypothetical protein